MFAAQPHLYGQQVPCPSCSGALTIPSPEQEAPAPAQLEAPAPSAAPAQPDDPLGGASFEQAGQMLGPPSQPAYRQLPPKDAPMSAEDKTLVMKAVFGVGGILLLLVVAIVITSLLGGDEGGETAADGDTGAETTDDGEAESGDDEGATSSKPKTPAGKSKSGGSGPAKATPKKETPTPKKPLSPEEEKLAVKGCFDSYRAAIKARKGKAAADLVATATLDYYDRMRQSALTAGEQEVRGMSFTDASFVLLCRHRLDIERLKSMDGKGLLAHGANEGWVGKQQSQDVTLGPIELDGDTASAQAMVNGQPGPFRFSFNKEKGQWKLDLMPLLNFANSAIEPLISMTGQTKEELILETLRQLTGQAPSADIWQPLFKE